MLEIRNLTKVYRPKRGRPVKALDGVSLKLPERGMVFILGKSGSGKSTLFQLIGGMDRPTGGEILFRGRSSAGFSQAELDSYRNTCVGFVFQEYQLLPEFTVRQNVALAAQLQQREPSDEEVQELLDGLEIGDLADRRIAELSGGQKQRAAIARALIKRPAVLLADEPTGALDSETGEQILEILKAQAADKLVLVVTHDREYAQRYGDRIIELKDGRIVADTESDASVRSEGRASHEGAVAFVKSRLRMKHAGRLGAAALRVKPIKLAITVLLSVIAFSLFGTSASFALYSQTDASIQTLIDNQVPYAILQKNYVIENKEPTFSEIFFEGVRDYLELAALSAEDISLLEERCGLELIGVVSWQMHFISQMIAVSSEEWKEILKENTWELEFNAEGLVSLTEKQLEQFGCRLTAGSLPREEDEIAVSDFLCRMFQLGGFRDRDGIVHSIETPSDLIGKELNTSIYDGATSYHKVTGIIDTSALPKEHFLRKKIFVSARHPMIAGADSLITQQIDNQRLVKPDRPSKKPILSRLCMPQEELSVCRWSQDSNGCLISVQELPYLLSAANDEYDDRFFQAVNQAITAYAREAYPAATQEGYSGSLDAFVLLIQSERNTYFDRKNYSDFLFEQAQKLLAEDAALAEAVKGFSLEFEFTSYNLTYQKDNVLPEGGYPVNGFFRYTSPTNAGAAVLEEDAWAELSELAGVYTYCVGVMPRDSAGVRRLVEFTENYRSDNVCYTLNLKEIRDVRMVTITLTLFRNLFLYAGGFLAVFSALLLSSFIANSVSAKSAEIGILRGLGARKSDVFKVFLAETLLIASVTALLSCVIAGILCGVVNSYLRTSFDITVTVLSFGLWEILLIFGITFLVAILSSLLPIYRIAKKQPVEAMKS